MGLIKAAISSVSGVFGDSWKEVIEPGDMTSETLLARGVAAKKGSNTKGTDNYITNGSIIHVFPNTVMLLIDGGKIVDFCAEEGYYEVNNSSAPSLLSGDFGGALAETWRRFQFGGTPSQKQYVYYVNTSEIKGIKFGTRNPVQYFDNFYNAELFLRAHGTYSVKINDPIKFYSEFALKGSSRGSGNIRIEDLSTQMSSEFMEALQAAVNKMSVDGVRISQITSKSPELSRYMADVLDENWSKLRGIEVCSVGIASISYDDESKALINMRNKGSMMADPAVREGFVQTSIAQGLQSAGSQSGGYMAMGIGMNTAGNFMSAASATNAAQMNAQARAVQAQSSQAGGWKCSCGTVNSGNFCSACGSKKPDVSQAGGWKCSCGTVNTGNFCSNCGSKKPDKWFCSDCGKENDGNFCSGCGKKRD